MIKTLTSEKIVPPSPPNEYSYTPDQGHIIAVGPGASNRIYDLKIVVANHVTYAL